MYLLFNMLPAGTQPIPNNELALANDLYRSLQEFYKTHKQYKDRPLYITGEVSETPDCLAQHNPAATMCLLLPTKLLC